MKTPIQSAISQILDESFAASVKLLKEEGLLSENIVFTEKILRFQGGGKMTRMTNTMNENHDRPRKYDEKCRKQILNYSDLLHRKRKANSISLNWTTLIARW